MDSASSDKNSQSADKKAELNAVKQNQEGKKAELDTLESRAVGGEMEPLVHTDKSEASSPASLGGVPLIGLNKDKKEQLNPSGDKASPYVPLGDDMKSKKDKVMIEMPTSEGARVGSNFLIEINQILKEGGMDSMQQVHALKKIEKLIIY